MNPDNIELAKQRRRRQTDEVMANIAARLEELKDKGGSVNWNMVYHTECSLRELDRFIRS